MPPVNFNYARRTANGGTIDLIDFDEYKLLQERLIEVERSRSDLIGMNKELRTELANSRAAEDFLRKQVERMARLMNASNFMDGYQVMRNNKSVPEPINITVQNGQPTETRKVSNDFVTDLSLLDLSDEQIKQSGVAVNCRGRGEVSYKKDDSEEIAMVFEKEAMKAKTQEAARRRGGLNDSKWANVSKTGELIQSGYQDVYGASNQTPRVSNQNERCEALSSSQEANRHTLPKTRGRTDGRWFSGFRAFYLENFPSDVTAHDILSRIRGGKIEYILTYFDQLNRAAMVVFMRPSDASDFYNYVEQHPIIIRGYRVLVSYSQKTSAHNVSARDINKMFGETGATRCLVIQNVPSWITAEKLLEDVKPNKSRKNNREHEWLECISLDAQGCAEVAFCSVREAMAAADTLAKMDEYRYTEIAFGRDRCEDPLGSQETGTKRK
ncbi:hypothetical protein RUND412_005113 [Rhizina undulata]